MFGSRAAYLEVELVADVGGLVEAEVVGGREEEGALREEPRLVAEVAVGVVVLRHVRPPG